MKWTKCFITLSCVACFLNTYSQDGNSEETKIGIDMRKLLAYKSATLEVEIGGRTFSQELIGDSIAYFYIPAFKTMKTVMFKFMKDANTLELMGKLRFTGSDMAYIKLDTASRHKFFLQQYPLIEFYSASGAHDIEIDGESIGSTETSKTVIPAQEHTLVWKKNNKVTCSTSVTLHFNQVRKYTCSENGQVSE